MLTNEEALALFKECGALLEGHFLLTSGLHSGQYMEKFRVLQFPHLTSRLCHELAERFRSSEVELVVGPATGGIILAFETGRILGLRALFTEREEGKMTLRRGFRINPHERVLVVEDVVTTGGSVMECIEAVRCAGGKVIGVGLLVDRSNGKVDFGVPTERLISLDIPAYQPNDCPLCGTNVELVKPGSRKMNA